MTAEEFQGLPKEEAEKQPRLLRALWHAGHGDWEGAHMIAQDIEDAEGSWVHAYLHRKEGDKPNAEYWYRRAGRPVFQGSLDDEWAGIVTELLGMPV